MKRYKNPKRRITAMRTATAPSSSIPMNSTASFVKSASCAEFAPIAFGIMIVASLRQRLSRLARLTEILPKINFRWCIKHRIAWLRRYALNLALIAAVTFLVLFLASVSWLHMTSPQTAENYFGRIK